MLEPFLAAALSLSLSLSLSADFSLPLGAR
jgi:hypothetical protein